MWLSARGALVLIAFSVAVDVESSPLQEDGDHVCTRTASFVAAFVKSYTHSYTVQYQFSGRECPIDWCTKNRTQYKTAYTTGYRTEYRMVRECCPGFNESEGICNELSCPRLTPLDQKIVITPTAVKYSHNAVIEYSCDGDFAVNGTKTSQCYNGTWTPFETPQCEAYEKIEQLLSVSNTLSTDSTTNEVRSVAEVIETATNDEEFVADKPERVQLIIESLEAVADAGDPSSEVTKPLVNVINNLMEQEETSVGDSYGTGRVIAALEQQISNLQSENGDYTQVHDNIGIKAVKINTTTNATSLNFGSIFQEGDTPTLGGGLSEENTVLLQDEVPVERTATSISIPSTILDHFCNVTDVPISFFIYGNSRLFVPSRGLNESNTSSSDVQEAIASQIISANVETGGLCDPETNVDVTVISKFLLDQTLGALEQIKSIECVSWSYDKETEDGFWSNEGCRRREDEDRLTVCSCDRLSSFAVLIRIRKDKGVPPEPLYWITLIGSIISCTCLVACIITFLTLKNIRGKTSTYIHMNLSISLLGFYLSFLLSGPAFRNSTACAVASAAIHYFCLATTIWMSIEALNLYWVFSKAEPKKRNTFLAGACVIGYGVPLLPTLLVEELDDVIIEGMADYCFIHPGPFLYAGFLAIIGLLFLFNITIFAWLIRKALCRRIMTTQVKDHAKREEIFRRIRHGVLFWFILGLSWIFAALAAVDVDTFTFEYLYSIFTALQGVVMFLLLCAANPEFPKMFSRFRRRGIPDSSISGTISTAVTATTKKSVSPGKDDCVSEVELTSVGN